MGQGDKPNEETQGGPPAGDPGATPAPVNPGDQSPAPAGPPGQDDVIAAQNKPNGGTAGLSPPAANQDVIIVPKKGTGGATGHEKIIFDHNDQWADQWVKADSVNRKKVTINVNGTWDDFMKVMTDAATTAKGKEVILFTGHGGAAGLRGALDTAFDTVPETKGMSQHKYTVKLQQLDELEKVATINAAGDKMEPKTGGVAKVNQDLIDGYDPWKYLGLVKLGKVFKANGVVRFTILSCNVGQDRTFGKIVARLMQTPVRVYQNLVATAERDAKQILIWITDNRQEDDNYNSDGEPKTKSDKNHPGFHEIPTNLQSIFTP